MQARRARTTQPTNASERYTIGAALTYVRAALTASLDGIDEPALNDRIYDEEYHFDAPAKTAATRMFIGGESGTRTPDQRIMIPLL
jgi:hypothetical protein